MLAKLNAQASGSEQYPTEWSTSQTEPKRYEIGLDKSLEYNGQKVVTIKSIKSKIDGFGSSMKWINADLYLGKTVKMSGYVKSENVKSWAGLWMRVDHYTNTVLAFDNMQQRGIKGTKDWEKYEIVLFVPTESSEISYGVLLNGTGQIWFKDVKLEVVEDTVPETGSNKGREKKVISFEKRAKAIANQIEKITDDQKKALKAEIAEIDKDYAKGIISKEIAEELKLKKAEERAANIDEKVLVEEEKLNQLIQDKVDGKITESDTLKKPAKLILIWDKGDKDYVGKSKKEKRTTTQFVLAFGANNLVTNEVVANSDFYYWQSHFFEWGFTSNTRIFKNDNLLHLKYGFSVMYNNICPTDNRYFVPDENNQTNLEIFPYELEDSRFKNVYLVAPVHLEFDFSGNKSKNGNSGFSTHKGVRFGIGGYGGFRIKSKQKMYYNIDDDKIRIKTKGDFNANDFIYGVSTYLGYKETSLYLKYDLNPLFENNPIDQNNISLGVRFDFN